MKPNIVVYDTNFDRVAATYYSSALGFRASSPSDTQSLTAQHGIVLTGDSFTFGVGVDFPNTFAALVDSALPDVRATNLALPGFGLDQMWMTVRHYGLPMKPAVVVLAFIDDDFDRSLTAFRDFEGVNKPMFVIDGDRLRRATPEDGPNAFAMALERHSAIWTLGRVVARRLAFTQPVGEWWSVNKAIIDSVRADCLNAGARLLVVRIPAPGTRPAFKTMRAYATTAGLDFLDLADPARRPPGIFFPRDGHINVKGHRYVANAILGWIAANLTLRVDSSVVAEGGQSAVAARQNKVLSR